MKKSLLVLFLLQFFLCISFAQNFKKKHPFHIIPKPVSVSLEKGAFVLNGQTSVIADSKSADMAFLLAQMLNESFGFHFVSKKETASPNENEIILRINSRGDTSLGNEGYKMNVSSKKILLSANKPHGLFYGIQTLLQILPPSNGHAQPKNISFKIPCASISDYPRFRYRGMMLDVSRHFFSKEFIKKYIDEMAKYKFNVFHWHLTDDQGWRIEIKGLPELTKVGAWRVPRNGRWGTFREPQTGEKASDGGYYTQDDIREIVSYAKKRFIDILPEIDVPAHSLALIASYPNLSCTQEKYPVSAQYTPKGTDDVLCVANDSTWLILDKIFSQVAQLFPYEYIHTGGDEANRNFWMKDPKDIALMEKEGIKTPAELQSYFEKKLEKLIISKGKRMIGWDEILEGGLAPEAVVMSWRGMKGGIEAAKMGHEVIMTPILETYLSRRQGDPSAEPFGPGLLRLRTCYQFEPVPDSVDPKFILGGQASTWTEKIPNSRHLEYMTWPRAMAISEVVWSPKSSRDWNDFALRVEQHFQYLDADSVKYSRSMYDPVITAVKGKDDSMKIKITAEMPGLTIYYTFDGTDPDNFYPEYSGLPLDIPKGASEIRAVSYRHGRLVSRQINYLLSDLKKDLDKK
jgi:hexosaminidase